MRSQSDPATGSLELQILNQQGAGGRAKASACIPREQAHDDVATLICQSSPSLGCSVRADPSGILGGGEPVARSPGHASKVHLAGLCLAFERQAPPKYIGRVRGLLAQERREYTWLEPPPLGGVTVCTVVEALSPVAHREATERWATHVWRAWSPHHAAIRAVIDALDLIEKR